MTPIERLGPHNIEAEEAVIGSVLINPEVMAIVSAFLTPADFFELKHAWLWETLGQMYTHGEAIDNLTLVDALRNRGKLEDIGGPAYITYLINSTPTHIYAETYGRIVEIAAVRRRLMAAAGAIAQTAREKSAELEDVIAECNALLNEATRRAQDREGVMLSEATARYFKRVEAIYKNPDRHDLGYPTGLYKLDAYLTRLERGGLYLIAARPGVGKTTLLLNIARNLVKRGVKVQFFSLEMSHDELVERLVSAETKIPATTLRKGQLKSEDWDCFAHVLDTFETWPFFLENAPSLTPSRLRTLANQRQRQFGLDAIMVDYIQLMSPDKQKGRRQTTVNEEVASISKALKLLARELNVPVLAACQLNRAGVGEPELHHLRDSGALEADTDGALLLWPNTAEDTLNVKIAKQRQGATGKIELYYQKATHTIACLTR